MTTAYTSVLKLALPVTGELTGTWGDVVNNNITSMIEEAITGKASISTWVGASHTLTTADGTTSESRCAILECSGTPGGAATVICPTATKIYVIKNSVDGGFAVTLKTSGGTGISVPNGKVMWLYCDGTNVVDATNHLSSLTLASALPVTSGGTGTTTSTGSGSVVLSSSPTISSATLSSPTLTTPNLGTPSAVTLTNGTGLPLTTGVTGTLPVANGGTGTTTSTGSGSVVLSSSPTISSATLSSPTLTTPNLGTPTAVTLTNGTGLPLTTGVTGTLPVGNGGTGATTLTGVLKGNGTSAFTAATAGTDYAKPDTASTWSAVQTHSKAIFEKKDTTSASNIDVQAASVYTHTVSGTTTFTVSNVPSTGTVAAFIMDITNGGSATVNFWSGVKWPGGVQPTLTTSGRDALGFYTYDGGTTWTGLVLGLDIK